MPCVPGARLRLGSNLASLVLFLAGWMGLRASAQRGFAACCSELEGRLWLTVSPSVDFGLLEVGRQPSLGPRLGFVTAWGSRHPSFGLVFSFFARTTQFCSLSSPGASCPPRDDELSFSGQSRRDDEAGEKSLRGRGEAET